MTNENELLQKLMISKKMMDIHNNIPRSGQGGVSNNMNSPQVQEFNAPQATYNLPTEFVNEERKIQTNNEAPSLDRIMNSKLPDEIKQLMIEYPIAQPNGSSGPVLSNELVEKASRLMGSNNNGNQPQNTPQKTKTNLGVDINTIKSIVRETIEEVLSENGLLTESSQKSNETFQFRVGKHIFEGKVTKIKKVQ